MNIPAPRLSPWGDCSICKHVRFGWRCGEPTHYAALVPVDQARAPAGWPYRDDTARLPAPTLDLSRPYSTGGACGPRARLLEFAR